MRRLLIWGLWTWTLLALGLFLVRLAATLRG
jgi:hypothetical protein